MCWQGASKQTCNDMQVARYVPPAYPLQGFTTDPPRFECRQPGIASDKINPQIYYTVHSIVAKYTRQVKTDEVQCLACQRCVTSSPRRARGAASPWTAHAAGKSTAPTRRGQPKPPYCDTSLSSTCCTRSCTASPNGQLLELRPKLACGGSASTEVQELAVYTGVPQCGCLAAAASLPANQLRRWQVQVLAQRLFPARRYEGAMAWQDGVPLPLFQYSVHCCMILLCTTSRQSVSVQTPL
jgi:hypothetical protein